MYPFASLPENLAAFCEALRRDNGFRIGPGELQDAARVLAVVDLANERAIRHALRPILAGTRDDVAVFDAAFTRFFFPAPAAVAQDQLPSTRREPGTDPDGRETDATRARHAPSSGADTDEATGLSGGTMTPIESTGDALEEAAILAPSNYSPLDANASDAPELPPIEQAWCDAARFVRSPAAPRSVASLEAGEPGATFRSSSHVAGGPADWRGGVVGALVAPPSPSAANCAAGRR